MDVWDGVDGGNFDVVLGGMEGDLSGVVLEGSRPEDSCPEARVGVWVV